MTNTELTKLLEHMGSVRSKTKNTIAIAIGNKILHVPNNDDNVNSTSILHNLLDIGYPEEFAMCIVGKTDDARCSFVKKAVLYRANVTPSVASDILTWFQPTRRSKLMYNGTEYLLLIRYISSIIHQALEDLEDESRERLRRKVNAAANSAASRGDGAFADAGVVRLKPTEHSRAIAILPNTQEARSLVEGWAKKKLNTLLDEEVWNAKIKLPIAQEESAAVEGLKMACECLGVDHHRVILPTAAGEIDLEVALIRLATEAKGRIESEVPNLPDRNQ